MERLRENNLWDEAREAERQFKSVYGPSSPSEVNPAILEDPVDVDELISWYKKG